MSDKSGIIVLDDQDIHIIEAEAKPSDFPITKGQFPVSK